MSELISWRERSASNERALFAVVEQMSLSAAQHYKTQSEVPVLLNAINVQLSALVTSTHSLVDGMSRTQESMIRIAVGTTRMVGSMDESRVVVSSAIRSLADTLSGLSQDGASVVKQLMSMEQVLVQDSAHSQRVARNMQIQQDAMLEVVGHISALSTAVAMGDEVSRQQIVDGVGVKDGSQ